MEKKELAIVTMSYGTNYGNKLQNYAMQVVYEAMGFEVETVRLKPIVNYTSTIREKFTDLKGKIIKRIKIKVYKNNIIERKKTFAKFDNEMLKFSEKEFLMNDYEHLNNEKYNIYSVGSDQVWNSYFDEFSSVFLLDCIGDNKTKIAYAASLGCESINPLYIEKFKNELKKFKARSEERRVGKECRSRWSPYH